MGIQRSRFLVVTSAADAAPIVELLIQQETVPAWSETRRSPGLGEFELDVELNRWDNRAFTFVADVGSIVEASIDGTADGVLAISSPLGVHLEADDSYSGVESGTVEILSEGVHYLHASTVFDGPATFTVTSSSRLQPLEDPDDGQHLSVGDIVGGVIGHLSDIDWYTIDLDEGETVVIWTDAITTDTAVLVDYPQADITNMAYDDDSGSTLFGESVNSELVYTAPATGQYTVAVADAIGASGGSYFPGIDTPGRNDARQPDTTTRREIRSLV